MNDPVFEAKVLHHMKNEKEHIRCPKASEILNEAHRKATEMQPCHSKRRKIRPLFVVIAATIVVVCFLGATFYQYWFPSNRKAFQMIQDRGYVNVINQTQKSNGISFTVQAILTDQLTTYVRIRAEGVKIGKTSLGNRVLGGSLACEIQDAVLSDQTGNSWSYQNQVIDQFDDVEVTTTSPILSSEELEKNEAILVFYGGPTANTQLNLEITFLQDETHFSFNDMAVKVPPVFRKQVSDIDFQTDFATGTVKEVVYTALETRFVIDWSVYGHPDQYYITNRGLYRNGDIEYEYSLPSPRFIKENDTIHYTHEFIVYQEFDPSKELVVDRYQNDYTRNMGTFLCIPED